MTKENLETIWCFINVLTYGMIIFIIGFIIGRNGIY
jgi:hypothetical protein